MDEFNDLFRPIERSLNLKVMNATEKAVEQITTLAADKSVELQGIVKANAKLTIKSDKGSVTLKGLRHEQLEDLIKITGQALPILMVGMAGTGKTHAAEQVAEPLKIPFYAMSVGAQTSKSDIIGFMHAGGDYVPTLFRKAYEEGGVFLMDEIDAGNANVLIQVNAALSNNYCAFPDGMVKRHEDFRFIGTANTFGNGANRMYVGRNQLDAATLDRFVIVNWLVDEKLEGALVKDIELGEQWHKAVQSVRKYVTEQDFRVLITPRATLRGAQLLNIGFELDYVIQASVLNSVGVDKQDVVKEKIMTGWNAHKPKKKLTNASSSADKAQALMDAMTEDVL